jgi:OOP family OmpA-OmpF porin
MKDASTPVLQQALAFLKKHCSLRVEVQGHTDNVGTDAYDQTLSDSRAAAVVALADRPRIAAARLTSNGYGKANPVADNGSEEGRAVNRRIEIADRRCVPKSQ